ncbi:DUF72 domain-containing protein [Sphingomonas koreensis]|nr:DUF72 domain-containing protein [Sphingomonas koreensis]
MTVKTGTAGWTIPTAAAAAFPVTGSHLERFSGRLNAAEINSSFYRPHRGSTYARWASSVPTDFRFSVKLPRAISHEPTWASDPAQLTRFADEIAALGEKLGCVLVQLPPKRVFERAAAAHFLTAVRQATNCPLVCEPRHASWFTAVADAFLASQGVARVAADPAIVPGAGLPGGWTGMTYRRFHGSPRMYYSSYDDATFTRLAGDLQDEADRAAVSWCIFDNTASGAAVENALRLSDLTRNDAERPLA